MPTKLSTIPKTTIWFWCVCGNKVGVDVSRFLEMKNPPVTVDVAMQMVRCSKCGARQITTERICYKGGSEGALAATGETPKGAVKVELERSQSNWFHTLLL